MLLRHATSTKNQYMGADNCRIFPSDFGKLIFILALVSIFFPSMAAAANLSTGEAGGVTYAVQAGLYVGPIQSNRMAENLTHAGYPTWVEERQQRGNKVLYFVLVGPFAEENQARDAAGAIRRQFAISPFVVEVANPLPSGY
jgi:hypothetical protein